MTYPGAGYGVACDEPGCNAEEWHPDHRVLREVTLNAGWQRNVNPNGKPRRILRGGKDFCPRHRKGN